MKRFIFLSVFVLFILLKGTAQTDPELHSSINNKTIERFEIKSGSLKNDLHYTMRPLSRKAITNYALWIDTATTMLLSEQDQYNLRHIFLDNNHLIPSEYVEESPKPIAKHFYNTPGHFFDVHGDGFSLQVNPIFYGNVGYDKNVPDNFGFINTRGGVIRATLDDKISLYSVLTENRVRYPHFVKEKADSLKSLPGQGFFQRVGNGSFDYFEPKGGISFDATKHVNLQLGYDKHFVGDGYRSLLLSRNSNNAPFLKFNTNFWKINYTNLYQELSKTSSDGPDTLVGKKYMVSHHLSFDVTNWLNIGLFESIVFARENQFEFHYLTPVIFYRAMEQQVGSPDNALIGINYSALIKNQVKLYGQLVIDEFRIDDIRSGDKSWANKFGFQQGATFVDAFGVNNFDLQAEFNRVRPYTYMHNNAISNYTHYGQALAHPLGANFTEFIGIASYQPIPKVRLNGIATLATYGRDPDERSWGGDIINKLTTDRPFDNGVTTGQGIKHRTANFQGRLSYEFKHNLHFDLQGVYKHEQIKNLKASNDETYFGASIRWNFSAYDYNF